MIENLRDQKEREDRARLEELEQLRKENQELKDKLSAVQPQKPSQSQLTNPGLTQNQRPDREVSICMLMEEVTLCWGQKKGASVLAIVLLSLNIDLIYSAVSKTTSKS